MLQSNYGTLNGFTPEAGRARETFLKDARKLLTEAGRHLAAYGVTTVRVQRLKVKLSDSGGVVSEFRVPSQQGYVEVTVATAAVNSTRPDRVAIWARRTTSTEECVYFPPDEAAPWLARRIAQFAGVVSAEEQ